MNLLITSIGRRTYLVEYFKKALNGGGKIYVANSEYTYSCKIADGYLIAPTIYDKKYINTILDFCKKNNICAILSVFDIDLLILAKNKEIFKKAGIQVIVPDPSIIETCNNKFKMYNFCIKNNINTPKTYASLQEVALKIKGNEVSYPVIIKPKWGTGSIGISIAEDEKELHFYYEKVKKDIFKTYLKYESAEDIQNPVLIQEFIDGKEYNLDVINDLKGSFVMTVVKEKINMRAGETDIAKVAKNAPLEILGNTISKKLKHIFNLDVDCILKNDKIYVIDLNCRLGGGFPFSYLSGVDLPLQLINWLKGENTDPELFKIRNEIIACKTITPVILT